jgi:hypothetical protein
MVRLSVTRIVSMRWLLTTAVLATGILSMPLEAQVVERPVPFDSAGRVMTISPSLAARLALSAPSWPVTGDFVEARLFDRRDGRFVLVIERKDRTVERYELSGEARDALQRATTAALRGTGGLTTGERADVTSEPARGQFVRDQTLAGAIVYGPALAAMTDGSASGALYLGAIGAAFFTSAQLAKGRTISRAQNHMSTDGIWRGAAIGSALYYAAVGDDDRNNAHIAALLGGSLAGSIIGFQAGRPFTDGEAEGATFGSTFVGLTTAGVIGAAGGYDGNGRGVAAGIVGAAVTGYPLGLRYVRRAPYAVTAGDVTALSTSSLVGALAAVTAVVDGDPSDQTIAAVLTGGFVAGALLGDRLIVRRYDLTASEGHLMQLGAVAGGVLGLVLPLAAKSEDGAVYTGLSALGAIAGMVLTKGIIGPAAGSRRAAGNAPAPSLARPPRGSSAGGVSLHLENLALLVSRRPTIAAMPVISVRF